MFKMLPTEYEWTEAKCKIAGGVYSIDQKCLEKVKNGFTGPGCARCKGAKMSAEAAQKILDGKRGQKVTKSPSVDKPIRSKNKLLLGLKIKTEGKRLAGKAKALAQKTK